MGELGTGNFGIQNGRIGKCHRLTFSSAP